MTENKENEINLIIRVIDSAISIKLTRKRSTDVIRNSILFQANTIALGLVHKPTSALLGLLVSNLLVSRNFDLSQVLNAKYFSVGPETRFCDFTVEDKAIMVYALAIMVYALAKLGTPSLMARVRALEAEKENLCPGASESESTNGLIDRYLRIVSRLFKAATTCYVHPYKSIALVFCPTANQLRHV